MVRTRLCQMCSKSINHRRKDAITCGATCRGKLFRSNRLKTVLVNFRVPNAIYTDIVINAFKVNKSISEYLTGMVVQNV